MLLHKQITLCPKTHYVPTHNVMILFLDTFLKLQSVSQSFFCSMKDSRPFFLQYKLEFLCFLSIRHCPQILLVPLWNQWHLNLSFYFSFSISVYCIGYDFIINTLPRHLWTMLRAMLTSTHFSAGPRVTGRRENTCVHLSEWPGEVSASVSEWEGQREREYMDKMMWKVRIWVGRDKRARGSDGGRKHMEIMWKVRIRFNE